VAPVLIYKFSRQYGVKASAAVFKKMNRPLVLPEIHFEVPPGKHINY
jgi:hypothetical protein